MQASRAGSYGFGIRCLLLSIALSLVFSTSAFATAPLPNPCTLLTNAQVGPVLWGSVQTRVRGGNGFEPSCTWTGPPEGYMLFRETLTLDVFRITKARFDFSNLESIPPATPFSGHGVHAYLSNGGLQAWQGGIAIEMDASYANVYPYKTLHLAQIALTRSLAHAS